MLLPKINGNNISKTIGIELLTIHTKDTISMDCEFDINNEKEKDKLIKAIEKFVRGSYEYRNYIGFLKGELNLTKCSFLNNIDIDEIKGVSLEFHHYPFTLYDIVNVVISKFEDNGEKINPFKISEEVMRIHYENKVGLVPVTVTVHQLIHNGQIFVPSDNIYGNYHRFIENYNEYISETHKDFIKIIEDRSEKIKNGETVLDTSIIARKTLEINNLDCEAMEIIETEQVQIA